MVKQYIPVLLVKEIAVWRELKIILSEREFVGLDGCRGLFCLSELGLKDLKIAGFGSFEVLVERIIKGISQKICLLYSI